MRKRTRQVLLLFALALSVIGMHHVPFSPHVTMSAEAHAAAMQSPAVGSAPQVQPASDSGPNRSHHILHLCLVVLSAVGGVVFLAWLQFVVVVCAFLLAGGFCLWARRVWRPPGVAGRALLTSLCVSRT